MFQIEDIHRIIHMRRGDIGIVMNVSQADYLDASMLCAYLAGVIAVAETDVQHAPGAVENYGKHQ